jgi:Fe-S cluster assembly protein SufD
MNIDTLATLADQQIHLSEGTLRSFRTENLEALKKKGFRELIPDSYKFTNIEFFLAGLSLDGGPSSAPARADAFPAPGIPTITFLDGALAGEEDLPAGVTVRKLGPHFHELRDLFSEKNALSHLHHALLNDGVILEVARKVEVAVPVRILNLATKASVGAPTVLIVAHPHSRLTVLEETRGLGEAAHVTVSETYIRAHEAATVEHITLQLESAAGVNHNSIFADVDRDATVRSLILTASGKLNRNNLTLNLAAPGAHGESYALFLTNGREHSDVYTEINHRAPDTTSNQVAKGILDGDSKGVFTGRIHIFPKAQRVASGQLNKNLLLSKKAQIHSQPQLEIFADDVKCSHGSTTGQLSPDEVFYFQARGIPGDRARNLLAFGFGLEVVQKIGNPRAREHVTAIIREALAEKFSLGRTQ